MKNAEENKFPGIIQLTITELTAMHIIACLIQGTKVDDKINESLEHIINQIPPIVMDNIKDMLRKEIA